MCRKAAIVVSRTRTRRHRGLEECREEADLRKWKEKTAFIHCINPLDSLRMCVTKNPGFTESHLWVPEYFNSFSSLAFCVAAYFVWRSHPMTATFLLIEGIVSFAFHWTLCVTLGWQDVNVLNVLLFVITAEQCAKLSWQQPEHFLIACVEGVLYVLASFDERLDPSYLEAYQHALVLMVMPALVCWERPLWKVYLAQLFAMIGWGVSELFYTQIPWIAYLQLLAVFHVTSAYVVVRLCSE